MEKCRFCGKEFFSDNAMADHEGPCETAYTLNLLKARKMLDEAPCSSTMMMTDDGVVLELEE